MTTAAAAPPGPQMPLSRAEIPRVKVEDVFSEQERQLIQAPQIDPAFAAAHKASLEQQRRTGVATVGTGALPTVVASEAVEPQAKRARRPMPAQVITQYSAATAAKLTPEQLRARIRQQPAPPQPSKRAHPDEHGSDFPELQRYRGQMGEALVEPVRGVPERTGKKHKVEVAKEGLGGASLPERPVKQVPAGTIAVDANPPVEVAAKKNVLKPIMKKRGPIHTIAPPQAPTAPVPTAPPPLEEVAEPPEPVPDAQEAAVPQPHERAEVVTGPAPVQQAKPKPAGVLKRAAEELETPEAAKTQETSDIQVVRAAEPVGRITATESQKREMSAQRAVQATGATGATYDLHSSEEWQRMQEEKDQAQEDAAHEALVQQDPIPARTERLIKGSPERQAKEQEEQTDEYGMPAMVEEPSMSRSTEPPAPLPPPREAFEKTRMPERRDPRERSLSRLAVDVPRRPPPAPPEPLRRSFLSKSGPGQLRALQDLRRRLMQPRQSTPIRAPALDLTPEQITRHTALITKAAGPVVNIDAIRAQTQARIGAAESTHARLQRELGEATDLSSRKLKEHAQAVRQGRVPDFKNIRVRTSPAAPIPTYDPKAFKYTPIKPITLRNWAPADAAKAAREEQQKQDVIMNIKRQAQRDKRTAENQQRQAEFEAKRTEQQDAMVRRTEQKRRAELREAPQAIEPMKVTSLRPMRQQVLRRTRYPTGQDIAGPARTIMQGALQREWKADPFEFGAFEESGFGETAPLVADRAAGGQVLPRPETEASLLLHGLNDAAAVAAALGDRSENADYIYGKRRLREIDRRVRFLKKRLDDLTVVTERPQNCGKVFFACWVKVDNEDGEEKVFRIVGPDETDAKRNFISIDSPVGRALMGKSLDDEVVIKLPNGLKILTILEIDFDELEP